MEDTFTYIVHVPIRVFAVILIVDETNKNIEE